MPSDIKNHAQTQNGVTALMVAADRGHVEVVAQLAKSGAALDIKNHVRLPPSIRHIVCVQLTS